MKDARVTAEPGTWAIALSRVEAEGVSRQASDSDDVGLPLRPGNLA